MKEVLLTCVQLHLQAGHLANALRSFSEMHHKVTVRTVYLKGGGGYDHIFFTLELVKGLLNGVEGERGEHLKVLSFAINVVEADGHVCACESLQGGH